MADIFVGAPGESIGAQINRLREECRWTEATLAEKIGASLNAVQRHISGKSRPFSRNISAYERVFSKQLNRPVFINMP